MPIPPQPPRCAGVICRSCGKFIRVFEWGKGGGVRFDTAKPNFDQKCPLCFRTHPYRIGDLVEPTAEAVN